MCNCWNVVNDLRLGFGGCIKLGLELLSFTSLKKQHVFCNEANQMIYTKDTLLNYLDGWAFLHHKRLGDVAVNSLPWNKKAIQDAAGRIAIRTTDAGGKSTVVWLDKVQDKFTTKTLVMSKSNKLVFHSFEYNKLDSLLTMRSLAPSCPMLPTVFWDLRNIKAAINIDYGGPDLHNEWVARNYKSLKGIFEGLGYLFFELALGLP